MISYVKNEKMCCQDSKTGNMRNCYFRVVDGKLCKENIYIKKKINGSFKYTKHQVGGTSDKALYLLGATEKNVKYPKGYKVNKNSLRNSGLMDGGTSDKAKYFLGVNEQNIKNSKANKVLGIQSNTNRAKLLKNSLRNAGFM